MAIASYRLVATNVWLPGGTASEFDIDSWYPSSPLIARRRIEATISLIARRPSKWLACLNQPCVHGWRNDDEDIYRLMMRAAKAMPTGVRWNNIIMKRISSHRYFIVVRRNGALSWCIFNIFMAITYARLAAGGIDLLLVSTWKLLLGDLRIWSDELLWPPNAFTKYKSSIALYILFRRGTI